MNVRTLCLGILSLHEATGYELKKEVEEGGMSHFIEASYGSIYPALTQLNAEGLLTVRAEEQSGKPDKKVYAITPAGLAALSQSLTELPARDKFKSEFLFTMLLQQHVSPEHRERAIMNQRAHLLADLKCIEDCRAENGDCEMDEGAKFVMGYGEAVLRAALKFIDEASATQKPRLTAAE